MSHFVWNNTSLPGAKLNVKPVTNTATQWGAEDANSVFAALNDLRAALNILMFNARSYGAVGDGVTDDATAITAAITAAATTAADGSYGAFVFLPNGTYLCGSQLVLPNGVGLRGAGPTATIIRAKSTFSATSLITNTSHDGTQEFAFLDGLQIDGHQAAGAACTTAVVDFVSLFVNSYIRNCIITNGSNVGLRLAATGSPGGMGPFIVDNTWVTNCLGDNVVGEETGGNTGACAGVYFNHLTSENQGTNKAAVRLTGLGHCTQWHLKNTHIEMGTSATGRVGIKLDGVSHALIDGVQLLTSAGTVTAGIQITNVVQNVGLQIRGVTNDNLINPVL